jgi:hypothetical protein
MVYTLVNGVFTVVPAGTANAKYITGPAVAVSAPASNIVGGDVVLPFAGGSVPGTTLDATINATMNASFFDSNIANEAAARVQPGQPIVSPNAP